MLAGLTFGAEPTSLFVMWVRVLGFALVGCCLAVACGGKSADDNSKGGDTNDAGQGNGGASATGGTSSGGRALGGTSGVSMGGSSRGGSGGGRGGTTQTGGSGGNAGEPDGGQPSGGQAGEGAGGSGGEPGACTTVGAIVITNELELSRFAELGCEVLEGSLTITSPTLTSLDALSPSPLRVITGTLAIENNPALDNFEGFEGLVEIGGSLLIQSSNVGDLGGLNTVRSIGSDSTSNALMITNNPRLESVGALGGVTRLLTSVYVAGNPVLASLTGIGGLQATSSVVIVNHTLLWEIGGLTELEETRNLTVSGNTGLLDASFPSLAHVESLTITGNDAVESVSLPVLVSAESFTIAGNQSLETVGTLDALMSVGSLIIAGNPRLPQCFVDALDARLGACNMTCGGNDTTAVCN